MKLGRLAPMRTAVALAHVRTGCTRRQIDNIVRLKNSGLKIAEWVSYAEPRHIVQPEHFSPADAIRRPYDPLGDFEYDYTPRAERFILGGRLIYLEMLFAQVCAVNLNRFVPLQFNSALDLIGSDCAQPLHDNIMEAYLRSTNNNFCRYLAVVHAQYNRQTTVRFGEELILWIDGRPKQPPIELRWHTTFEGMMDFIRRTDSEVNHSGGK